MIRGVAIDFDREEDLCFFSVDLEGRDADVCWSVPQEQLSFKRFHPLDQTLRVGGLAIAPDGHSLAMRFGTPGGLSPPAVFDLATEQTTLIVPDEAVRRAWLELLVRTSRSLLAAALPLAIAEGKPADRPTLLPLPDEVPPGHPLHARLAKLGRYGSVMCATRRGQETAEAEGEGETMADREDRLFFDYLRGDFAAAGSDLDALEPRITTHAHRLALLSLRAQILWGRGETSEAREVAEYLVEAVGGPVHRVEETPMGRSLVPEPGWGRPWARYLATCAGQPPAAADLQADPIPGNRDEPMPRNLFAPPGDRDPARTRTRRSRAVRAPPAGRSARADPAPGSSGSRPAGCDNNRRPPARSRSGGSNRVARARTHFDPIDQSTVNSTIRAPWMTRARSSGVIVPRATMSSSRASVLRIT